MDNDIPAPRTVCVLSHSIHAGAGVRARSSWDDFFKFPARSHTHTHTHAHTHARTHAHGPLRNIQLFFLTPGFCVAKETTRSTGISRSVGVGRGIFAPEDNQ